jgi:hypothetical protein
MKTRNGMLLGLVAVLALSWAAVSLAADDDQVYFAQQTFYAEKGKYIATNYHVGTLIPINSRVKIVDVGNNSMKIELPDLGNMEVKIENVNKYTQKTMEEIKDRMFGMNQVDLKKFPKDVQESIKSGQLVMGMTKQAVLLAYGYPPAHATPSTDMNQWTYWKNRWNRIILDFDGDKLRSIRD